MKKDVKLRSIYFPFYAFILLDYAGFLPMLPINFAVTVLVIFLVLKLSKARDIKKTLKASVWKAFGAGLLADLMGVLFRFLPLLAEKLFRAIGLTGAADYLGKYWSDMVIYNLYLGDVAPKLIYTVLSILFAGVFVFLFNYFFALKTAMPDKRLRKRTALALAVCTAPYSFMNPFW